MTSDEADQRIILSRTTLHRYVQMADALHWPLDDLPMLENEIVLLEHLAEEHPGKVEKIMKLVQEWVAFHKRVRAQLK